jgi:hypothetical protein
LARIISILSMLCLVFLVVSPAEGGRANAYGCGAKEFSYAGLQSENKAHGVSATITALDQPSLSDGHVGGWIGVGGTGACNSYAYKFSNVSLAKINGGVWQPVKKRSLFQDAGYQVVQTSRDPSNFVTTSLG